MLHRSTPWLVAVVVLGCSSGSGGPDGAAGHGGDGGSMTAGGGGAGGTGGAPGGAGGGSGGAGGSTPTLSSGVLVGGSGVLPGPIAGVAFASGGVSGVTDASGSFSYTSVEDITFQVADISLRPAAGAAMLSPFQLVADGSCSFGPELEKLLVLIYSLDEDEDPSTGTTLPQFPTNTPTRELASMTLAEVNDAIAALAPGHTPLSPAEAVDRFVRLIDDEAWEQQTVDTFTGLTALRRGQGVAFDGSNWFFSGTLSLERADLAYATLDANDLAIPLGLALQGSDHIGDIDVYAGTLYAPIEDGGSYGNPMLVHYDAATLGAGAQLSIPQALQTEGVPWVAANGPVGEIYFAEWNPTVQLNVFSLANATYLRSVTLHWPPEQASLGRIQGAKVFDGALYMASDEAEKTVYKVNLDTGTVLRLFTIPISDEQEGLAVGTLADGTELHTLNVSLGNAGVELRHHLRNRLPLRHDVCP